MCMIIVYNCNTFHFNTDTLLHTDSFALFIPLTVLKLSMHPSILSLFINPSLLSLFPIPSHYPSSASLFSIPLPHSSSLPLFTIPLHYHSSLRGTRFPLIRLRARSRDCEGGAGLARVSPYRLCRETGRRVLTRVAIVPGSVSWQCSGEDVV